VAGVADDDAPGWDSIEAAFRARYGDAAPEHRAPPPGEQPPAEGAALNGISAYRGDDHWHLVTFGFTELFAKAPEDDPEVSGWGHELTLLTPPAEHPPDWAFALLMGVARTARAVGRPFHAGARLAPGEPVDGAGSGLVALGLREDPLVTPTAFPFGRYAFLQVVGVTAGEYGVMRKVGTDLVLAKLAERDPLLRTDPARA
jgi:hypothetical protein